MPTGIPVPKRPTGIASSPGKQDSKGKPGRRSIPRPVTTQKKPATTTGVTRALDKKPPEKKKTEGNPKTTVAGKGGGNETKEEVNLPEPTVYEGVGACSELHPQMDVAYRCAIRARHILSMAKDAYKKAKEQSKKQQGGSPTAGTSSGGGHLPLGRLVLRRLSTR